MSFENKYRKRYNIILLVLLIGIISYLARLFFMTNNIDLLQSFILFRFMIGVYILLISNIDITRIIGANKPNVFIPYEHMGTLSSIVEQDLPAFSISQIKCFRLIGTRNRVDLNSLMELKCCVRSVIKSSTLVRFIKLLRTFLFKNK